MSLDRTPLISSHLKLFAAEMAAEDVEVEHAYRISPENTLGDFFEHYFLPVILKAGKAKVATIAEYRTAVRRWVELTGDPPLQSIDNVTCAKFIEMEFMLPGRREEKEISPNTIRKHCGALQYILHIAGPQSERFPQAPTAYGLFGLDSFGRPRLTPFFNKPKRRDKLPEEFFTIGEIRSLIEAAQSMKKPVSGQFMAAAWWMALLRFLYNTGLRIGSTREIRREWIFHVPQADGGFSYVQIPGDAYKQSRSHLIYLNRHAIAAIEPMPKTGKIFPWFESPTSLGRQMKRLITAAGIPQEKYSGLAFHGMRKSLGTALWGVNQEAARLQLGHASKSTTEQSYAGSSQLANSLAAAVGPFLENLEQP